MLQNPLINVGLLKPSIAGLILTFLNKGKGSVQLCVNGPELFCNFTTLDVVALQQ